MIILLPARLGLCQPQSGYQDDRREHRNVHPARHGDGQRPGRRDWSDGTEQDPVAWRRSSEHPNRSDGIRRGEEAAID